MAWRASSCLARMSATWSRRTCARRVARDFKALVEGKLQQIEGASWTQDGHAVAVEVRANRISYAGQSAVLLHVRDMTDRKLAEAALRSSEMLFHSVWENSADGMRLTDENGTIVAVNEAFCTLVGIPREDLEGKPFTVIYADSAPMQEMLEQYRQRFQDRVIEKQVERRVTLHNGNVVTFEDTSSFVELRGQPLIAAGPVPRHHGAEAAGGAVAPIPKDGSHRPAGRRSGP